VAAAEPDRLTAMIERWWVEAEANGVLPIDNRPFSEMVFGRPTGVRSRDHYSYWPNRAPVPEAVAVNVRGRPHTVTAHVTIPPGVAPIAGALVVQGSVLGGWSFHLLPDGRLVYVHNLSNWRTYRVEAPVSAAGRLGPGDHTLAMRFIGPAVELLVDGAVVGSGMVDRTVWSKFSITGSGLTVGWAADFSPADEDYRGRFPFTGVLHRVDIDVSGEPVIDPETEAADAIASQ
jgi:arylsulfatase